MHCNAFYSFTKTTNSLQEKNINSLQYQGYLDTEDIFTPENNPFSQTLFEINNTSQPKKFDIKENLMLGKRVEAFFRVQIKESDSYEILLENIQIQKEKRTIGELDFILKNTQAETIKHVEVTYKFYLFDPNVKGDEINKWIGPNRNDDLVKKIMKLSSHQFPLLYSQECKETTQLNTDTIKQEVFFKAQLYIPFNLLKHKFLSINSKAICGYYISFEEFKSSKLNQIEYFIPKKQNWLISEKENTTWSSFDAIQEEIGKTIQEKKSPLVWLKNKNGTTQRLFITWW